MAAKVLVSLAARREPEHGEGVQEWDGRELFHRKEAELESQDFSLSHSWALSPVGRGWYRAYGMFLENG